MRSHYRRRIQKFAAIVFSFLRLGLATGSLVWIAVPHPVAAQSNKGPAGTPRKYIFLLPDGFRGWICVDFGIAGAAPLPREGDALVVRPRPGEVLSTSDKAAIPLLAGDAWLDVNGERKPLPKDVDLQSGLSRGGPSDPTERGCAFVGTLDEREAAGDSAPGFENLS
jgi:hypothetical protein